MRLELIVYCAQLQLHFVDHVLWGYEVSRLLVLSDDRTSPSGPRKLTHTRKLRASSRVASGNKAPSGSFPSTRRSSGKHSVMLTSHRCPLSNEQESVTAPCHTRSSHGSCSGGPSAAERPYGYGHTCSGGVYPLAEGLGLTVGRKPLAVQKAAAKPATAMP
jgi:hypothetical protein